MTDKKDIFIANPNRKQALPPNTEKKFVSTKFFDYNKDERKSPFDYKTKQEQRALEFQTEQEKRRQEAKKAFIELQNNTVKTQYSKSTIADAARFKRPVPITTPSLGNITGAQEEQLFTKSNIYSKDHTVEKNVFYGDEISNFPLPVEPGSEFESNFNNVDNIENVVSEPDVIVSENIDSVPEIGEYRVYVGNENIFSTKNLSTLELFIFKAVKEYNVNVNDLVIIKRLDIKIGAFIEE